MSLGAEAGAEVRARLTHLDELEAEAIHVFREAAAECLSPVLLYSIGKDSSVLLRLAQRAFAPGPVPFPLLHVDTGWEFREMAAFRDRVAEEHDHRASDSRGDVDDRSSERSGRMLDRDVEASMEKKKREGYF